MTILPSLPIEEQLWLYLQNFSILQKVRHNGFWVKNLHQSGHEAVERNFAIRKKNYVCNLASTRFFHSWISFICDSRSVSLLSSSAKES